MLTVGPFKVEIIESEKGWGQRVDEVRYFPTREKAQKFIDKHNEQNKEAYVPHYYFYARLVE